MSQQRAIVKSLDGAPSKRRNGRIKAKSLTFSVKCDLSGSCELTFEGSMTEPFLSSNRFAVGSIFESQLDRAYIDLTEVKRIDDAGIEFLLQLMKRIERRSIKFQLLYVSGQVGSKIESSGLTSYFAKPTWVCR